MFHLNKLTSTVKKRKTIGRGGSRGGYSGRGSGGQKKRTGDSNMPAHFEGGQMPLIRRLPKRGFNNARFAKEYAIVNLNSLELWFNAGQEVTKAILFERGYLKGNKKALLKILGEGVLSKPLTIYADAASKTALTAIESAGGKVHLTQEM